MGRLPPNPALAFSGRTQNTCSTAQPPISEPIPDCEQNVPAQCDLTEGVAAYPRDPGENLFCYYQRLFQIVFTGGDTGDFLSKFNNLSELTDPATARTNLGLGSVLSDISTLEGDVIVLSGDVSTLRNDVNVNTADIGILRLDVDNLGTLSLQNANSVSITGGSITGITDLAVADGGTGASTAAGARVNLLPSLGGQAGKVLAVNGTSTDVEWITPAGGTSSVTVSSTPPVSPSLGDLWWDDEVGQLKIWYVDANSAQWVDAGSGGGGGGGGGVSSVTASGVLSSSGGSTPNITLSGVVPVANGGTGASDAGTARTNLGLGAVLGDISTLRTDVNTSAADIATLRTDVDNLGTLSAQNANSVSITGGSITGITDLAIADGGTGASDAANARTNLGLGAAATRADSYFLQTANNLSDLPSPSTARTNLGVSATADVMLRANNFSDIGNVGVARANLGIGSLASQDSTLVNITGGSITGITDLAVADGGTGASDAGTARTNLGLGSIATQAASSVSITGGSITGITDLAIADGGTGASDAGTARTNLGLGTMATQNSTLVSITGGSAVLEAANIGLLALTPTPGYSTSGNIQLRFDIGNNIFIPLAGDANFAVLPPAGVSSGRIMTLNLRNTHNATISLVWPSWYPTGTAFPASLGVNESLCVRAECYGPNITDIYAQCVSATASAGRVYNVKSYGAVGDGVANDTGAINLAILALNSTGGTLYFPEGTYKITDLLDVIEDTAQILGQGITVSTIVQATGNRGVFKNVQSGRSDGLQIQDIRLSYSGSPNLSSQAAVLVQNTVEGINDNSPNLSVTNVDIRCAPGSQKAFTFGFQLENVKSSLFSQYLYTGTGVDATVGYKGTGIEYKKYGATLSAGWKCVASTLNNCFFTLCEAGLRIKDSTEGIMLSNAQMVGLKYGLHMDYCIHVGVMNSHINAVIPLYSSGTSGSVDQGVFVGNLLYQQDLPNMPVVTTRAGVVGPFDRSSINSNTFLAPSAISPARGIYISGGSGNVANDNIFYQMQEGEIYFACNNSVARGSTRTSPGLSSGFVDAGSNNRMGDSAGFTAVYTLTGGSSTETVSLDISACNLGKKPDGGLAQLTSGLGVNCQYDWDDAGNSATTARIRFFRYDSGAITGGAYRITARFGP